MARVPNCLEINQALTGQAAMKAAPVATASANQNRRLVTDPVRIPPILIIDGVHHDLHHAYGNGFADPDCSDRRSDVHPSPAHERHHSERESGKIGEHCRDDHAGDLAETKRGPEDETQRFAQYATGGTMQSRVGCSEPLRGMMSVGRAGQFDNPD